MDTSVCLALGSSQVNEKFKFHSRIDPFVEISLMNLFELILSPTVLSRIDDLELITSSLSSISLSVLNISYYELINLEKLRSFRSLLRCIQILDPNQTLNIFQQCFKEWKFDATFQSCADIHQFIIRLGKCAPQRSDPSAFDGHLIESTLLKLEIEFLKNWLYHNKDQYLQVFDLINQTENKLWKYSAKIVSSIVENLQLSDEIEESYKFITDLSDETTIAQLDVHLKTLAKHKFKIHRLLVDRLYLEQCLNFTFNDQEIKKLLDSQCNHYIQSVAAICRLDLSDSSTDLAHVKLVRLLAWVRFYSQCYAYSLIHHVPFEHSEQLDRDLTDDQLPFCSTLKLFLVKQIRHQSNTSLDALSTDGRFRQVMWFTEFFQQMDTEEPGQRREVIVPIPLGVARDEYTRVDSILSDLTNAHGIENLLVECSSNHRLSYCFHLWLIRQYLHGSTAVHEQYRTFFCERLSEQVQKTFSPTGLTFLRRLFSSGPAKSHLTFQPGMPDRDTAIRLVVLNIFALALSFKSLNQVNWLSRLLFNQRLSMPRSHCQHLQAICLFGMIDHQPIIVNMKDVRLSARRRLKANMLLNVGKHIYQCSTNCLFFYSITHGGNANERRQCQFCGREIGQGKFGRLIARDPPQIKLTLEKGLKQLDEHIQRANNTTRLGYYEVRPAEQSTQKENSDHLKKSMTLRFLHLITHSILLVLCELSYLSADDLEQWNIPSPAYLAEHVKKDYELLELFVSDSSYTSVWLFQMFDRLFENFSEPWGNARNSTTSDRVRRTCRTTINHSVQ